jgi:Zn-finger protein
VNFEWHPYYLYAHTEYRAHAINERKYRKRTQRNGRLGKSGRHCFLIHRPNNIYKYIYIIVVGISDDAHENRDGSKRIVVTAMDSMVQDDDEGLWDGE